MAFTIMNALKIDWPAIETVFLDMDGTLLDLRFDNHFWLEHVPLRYAQQQGISVEHARAELLNRYRAAEDSLAWYCVDYWTQELGLDIARLKAEVAHLIAVHPHVLTFLDYLRQLGKRRVLVTNAHWKSIDLKLQRTPLSGHVERVICAHDLGLAKEHAGFWSQLHMLEPFDCARTLLIDDNPDVLTAAQKHGIQWLLAIGRPDSGRPPKQHPGFMVIQDFSELFPAALTE